MSRFAGFVDSPVLYCMILSNTLDVCGMNMYAHFVLVFVLLEHSLYISQGSNVFLDAAGNWWLGDFGSAVREGEMIASTTPSFAPRRAILGRPARKGYDW